MGFEVQRIVSDECHYGQYECIICQSLVELDCLVTTACSHVFCRTCLLQWLQQPQQPAYDDDQQQMEGSATPKCPTCNRNLLFSSSEQHGTVQNATASMMVGGRALLVQPLEVCQPLAHRVLKRIQVSCPLQHVSSCSWQGDYGDLQNHLLSPTAHSAGGATAAPEEGTQRQPMDVESTIPSNRNRSNHQSEDPQPRALATALKEEANAKFATQHYQEARDLYTKALAVLDVGATSGERSQGDEELGKLRAALYSNRAACHHGLNDFGSAVEDAAAALDIDPIYIKAYVRKAKALVQLADFEGAISALEQGLTCGVNPTSSVLQKEHGRVQTLLKQHEKGLELLSSKQYAAAKAELGNVLRETTAPAILLQAAQADLGMGLVDSARRLCLQALRRRRQDSEQEPPGAYLVQGQCNILSSSKNDEDGQQLLDSGIALLRRAMRLDPDSPTAASVTKQWLKACNLLKQARLAAFGRQFESALEQYSTCIQIAPLLPPKAPLYSVLYTERAKVLLRLKKHDAVLQDIALVLYHREDHVEAWQVRFAALHGKGKHEIVLEETEDLLQTWGQGEPRIRQAHEQAEFEVRKARRPDFYQMLGVSSIASEREIKKAYRQAAMDSHPDRFANATEDERKRAQQQFQTLSQGLEILTDDFQRKLYDEGYDPEAIKERVQAAEHAAHRSNHRHGHYGGYHGGHV